MKKDVLKDDIIEPKKFHKVIMVFMGIAAIFTLIMGIYQIIEIDSFLNEQYSSNQKMGDEQSLEIWDIRITNAKVQMKKKSSNSKWRMYATLLNIDSSARAPIRNQILIATSNQNRTFYGVESHPSFMIRSKDLSFWKRHLYLKTILMWGSLFAILVCYMVIIHRKYQREKLFITPIKNTILSLAGVLLGGLFLKWGLDFWLFNFLNEQFYLGEQIPPLESTLLYIALPVVVLAAYVEQAVRLQKEQDLTI